MSADLRASARLTDAERGALLQIARASIRAAMQRTLAPAREPSTPPLDEPAAVFVSLHQNGRLRGCIGSLTADRPLREAVARMAVSAAFDDPRFPPLTERELPATAIEISRLGPLTPAGPAQLCPGRHGIYLTNGGNHAVFLPQVARQHRWDRETLLNELCVKALLPPEAWKQAGTALMLFEAEVFSDEDGADVAARVER
ncbi:MAG: AmmeMemoRadiSam system protein A [Candidatus Binatia bacterium]